MTGSKLRDLDLILSNVFGGQAVMLKSLTKVIAESEHWSGLGQKSLWLH